MRRWKQRCGTAAYQPNADCEIAKLESLRGCPSVASVPLIWRIPLVHQAIEVDEAPVQFSVGYFLEDRSRLSPRIATEGNEIPCVEMQGVPWC